MGALRGAKGFWQIVVACGLALVLAGCAGSERDVKSSQGEPSQTTASTTVNVTTLDGWVEGSSTLGELIDFVRASVDENSPGYIPPEDRIAVFDMDGTLMGERFPTHFIDWLYIQRALYDDSYQAPEDLTALAKGWEDKVLGGGEMEESERRAATRLFEGLTIEGYKDVVRAFKAKLVWGFEGMTYGETFFKPMVSVVEYLHDNGYTVYVNSGTGRDALRVMMEGTLDEWIPQDRVIGTDFVLKATGQGDEDSLEYTMGPDEDLVIGDDYLDKNLRTNKVLSMEHEIGKHPVLAFGNSGSDFAMANYVLQNEDYQGAAFMLLCDDTERDYGDTSVAEEFAKKCEAAGFHTVSMRDDWTTIYGEGVHKAEAKDVELAAAA